MTSNCPSLSLPWRCYSLDLTKNPLENPSDSLIAISSFIPSQRSSKIQFAHFSDSYARPLLECEQPFPITKVQWMPSGRGRRSCILASSGLDLHLWRIDPHSQSHSHQSSPQLLHLTQHTTLSNKKNLASPPLTSFDWCKADPSILATACIDTTCTVWNVETQQIKCQLIAHDKEVFDVAFSPSDPYRLISVGADASLRLFDLRALDKSTIMWENEESTPLFRCLWNQVDDFWVAVWGQDSATVSVLDLRMPGKSWASLRQQHLADITGVAWSPLASNVLASSDEDGMIMLWDLAVSTTKPLFYQQMEGAVTHLKWSSVMGNRIFASVENEVVTLAV